MACTPWASRPSSERRLPSHKLRPSFQIGLQLMGRGSSRSRGHRFRLQLVFCLMISPIRYNDGLVTGGTCLLDIDTGRRPLPRRPASPFEGCHAFICMLGRHGCGAPRPTATSYTWSRHQRLTEVGAALFHGPTCNGRVDNNWPGLECEHPFLTGRDSWRGYSA